MPWNWSFAYREKISGWEQGHITLLEQIALDEFDILHYAAIAELKNDTAMMITGGAYAATKSAPAYEEYMANIRLTDLESVAMKPQPP